VNSEPPRRAGALVPRETEVADVVKEMGLLHRLVHAAAILAIMHVIWKVKVSPPTR
jgi:hypothetical protein